MKKTTYCIAMLITLFSIQFLGCGDPEVSVDTLLESIEDYETERVRVTGEIYWWYTDDDGSMVIKLESSTDRLVRINCYFPIDQPAPEYLRADDIVTISGVVRGYSLWECKFIELVMSG